MICPYNGYSFSWSPSVIGGSDFLLHCPPVTQTAHILTIKKTFLSLVFWIHALFQHCLLFFLSFLGDSLESQSNGWVYSAERTEP
jgi:hypothetical protein